jgi:hypothetical protein
MAMRAHAPLITARRLHVAQGFHPYRKASVDKGTARCVAVHSRCLSNDAIEARVPAFLSLALVVPDEMLATWKDRRLPDGPRARLLLCGMLLGPDVAPVRRPEA